MIRMKKSLRNTLLINIGAFVLVLILELLGGWMLIDKYDTFYSFYLWGLSFTISIMTVIWINHFILIPYLFDRKKYLLYGFLLIGAIFLGVSIKIYPKFNWIGITKMSSFLIYTTGTGMAAFFLRRSVLMQRQKEEKEKLQKDMELNYLKEQVNPHFLFNALNSIYALSRQRSSETPDVVMQLSDLVRYQLESSKKDTVLLKEELEFIENYLLLEEKRLSKRCVIEFSIDGDVLGLKIPPMLLIPFVENAVKHGAQSTNEQSEITVVAAIKSAVFHFQITNSKPSNYTALDRKGMGLENVRRRLNLLYPNSHTLEIKDTAKAYYVNLSIDLKQVQ